MPHPTKIGIMQYDEYTFIKQYCREWRHDLFLPGQQVRVPILQIDQMLALINWRQQPLEERAETMVQALNVLLPPGKEYTTEDFDLWAAGARGD